MRLLGISICIVLFIIFLLIIIYFSTKTEDTIVWPPDSYMSKMGGRCPDYWTFEGIDRKTNQVVCKNNYNIPINSLDITQKCMNTTTNNIRFTNYTTWPPKGEALYERCRWIQGCGEKPQLQGSWIGIDKLCSEEENIPSSPTYSYKNNKCSPDENGSYPSIQECYNSIETENGIYL